MREIKLLMVLSAMLFLSACGDKAEEDANSAAGSPLPEIEVQCGETSCM
ncbi:hypothetical protein ACES2L_14340 [Bdellovibrio bacteriovorus]